MAKYKMVTLTNPVEGKEEAYNDWYQNTHLAEVVQAEGMVSAQRFRVKQELLASKSWPYLCIYDIETDDIDSLIGGMGRGNKTMTDAMDFANAYTVIFEEFGDPVTHEQAIAKLGGG